MKHLAALTSLFLLFACGTREVPPDIDCAEVARARGTSALTDALESASAGDCVLLTGRTYRGAFVVPAGVKLVGSGDERFVGLDGSLPAIRAMGGAGTLLFQVSVVDAAGVGILIDGGPATLDQVVVENALETGILARCREAHCDDGDHDVLIRDAIVRNNHVGLWALGATVRLEGGIVADQSSERVSGGYGVLATHRARLVAESSLVSGNQEAGVVLDGDGTRAELDDISIIDNLGRGVWAQGLRGTSDDPHLVIRGAGSRIEGNRIVGVGARDALGIIIVDARIGETQVIEVDTDIGERRPVGDGVGLFAGTGEVRIEGARLDANERAQVLVDQGSVGIILVDCIVGPELSGLGVVIQDTPAGNVTVPEEDTTEPENPLAVSSSEISIPAID